MPPTSPNAAAISTLESDDEDELGASIWKTSRTARLISAKKREEGSESELGIKATAIEPASSRGGDGGGSECASRAAIDATAPYKTASFDPEVEANDPDHENVGGGSPAEIAEENNNENTPRSGGSAFASNPPAERKSLRKRKPTLFFGSEFGLEEKRAARKQKLHEKDTPRANLPRHKKKAPPELLEPNCVPKSNSPADMCKRRGKWVVSFSYQKRTRHFGNYGSREEALLAKRIAREQLEATGGFPGRWPTSHKTFTNDEIESNVRKAKEAVAIAMGRPAPVVPKPNGTPGVYERGGKWVVQFRYQNRNPCFGTYGSREEALLANRTAREQLEATGLLNGKCSSGKEPLTADEIELNIKKAKEAVAMAMGRPAPGTTDIYKTPEGNWMVRFWYQKRARYFGTYGSREEALLANRIARERLEATGGFPGRGPSGHKPLTADEIESNVKGAKEAVARAMGAPAPAVPKPNGTVAVVKAKGKSQVPESDGTGGVYERRGKWKVQLRYQRRARCFGTYGSREEALLANRIAREQLEATGGLNGERSSGNKSFTGDEIEANVKKAKEAVATATGRTAVVPKSNGNLYKSPGGKWKVQFWYQKGLHYFGTYGSREVALLASRIAREQLEAMGGCTGRWSTDHKMFTNDEIESNVKKAKEAVAKAMGVPVPVVPKASPIKRGRKWVVQLKYQDITRYFGTYGSREEALLANRIVRERLGATGGLNGEGSSGPGKKRLTADEIESNIQDAKEAVTKAMGAACKIRKYERGGEDADGRGYIRQQRRRRSSTC